MVWLRDDNMFNRFDRIPACDRQTDRQTDKRTDGQTSCHGLVRAMRTRRAVKMLQKLSVAGGPHWGSIHAALPQTQ